MYIVIATAEDQSTGYHGPFGTRSSAVAYMELWEGSQVTAFIRKLSPVVPS